MTHFYKPFDLFILLKDQPEYGLVKGQLGVILEAYKQPTHAYEVEFVAEDGTTIAGFAILPDQIEPYMDETLCSCIKK